MATAYIWFEKKWLQVPLSCCKYYVSIKAIIWPTGLPVWLELRNAIGLDVMLSL